MVVNPERVCADDRRIPYLDFDLIVRNGTAKPVQVRELRASVFDAKGELVEARRVWQQSMDLLGPNRTVGASSEGLLFNPFLFTTAGVGTQIRYELIFSGDVPTASTTFAPQSCITKARLQLPVRGRVLVLDGHDLYSHHRRSAYLGAGWRSLGITDNTGRMGLDLVTVDAQGRLYAGDSTKNENWLSWNQPVLAAGDGKVVAIHNEHPENDVVGNENRWTERSLAKNEMAPAGNYVLIDHGGGEFSLAQHLRMGSVRVSVGEMVKAGQPIGAVGNSGSSLGPHLHYELRTGWGIRGTRNLPAYFHGVTVIGSGEGRDGKAIMVNTGDVLLAP
jgi:hypothetical protein